MQDGLVFTERIRSSEEIFFKEHLLRERTQGSLFASSLPATIITTSSNFTTILRVSPESLILLSMMKISSLDGRIRLSNKTYEMIQSISPKALSYYCLVAICRGRLRTVFALFPTGSTLCSVLYIQVGYIVTIKMKIEKRVCPHS